jgi:hypothetical protein
LQFICKPWQAVDCAAALGPAQTEGLDSWSTILHDK